MLHRIKRAAAGALVCGILAAGFSQTAMAAVKKNETRIPIESVSISIWSDVKADYDVEAASLSATTDSNLYTIGTYEWVNNKDDTWELGDVPKVTIEIHARSGYYFNKVSGVGKFQISGGTFSGVKPAKNSNNETLLLTVKLPPVAGTLDESELAEWVGYPVGKASWEAVPYAGAYELKLYRNDQNVFSVPKVNATFYDFYPHMTTPGRYQFKVRAIAKDSEEEGFVTGGNWVYSDYYDMDSDQTVSSNGPSQNNGLNPSKIGWTKNSEGWWYQNPDGTYPAGDWKVIDGAWYLFGYDGYMLTGWQARNGRYYYLDDNGRMKTGWFEDNRKWYYLGSDGAMAVGWLDLGGSRYYMNPDGSMLTGWLLDQGKWYYFNPNGGAMMKNTNVGGYYLNSDGVWTY